VPLPVLASYVLLLLSVTFQYPRLITDVQVSFGCFAVSCVTVHSRLISFVWVEITQAR
jgi:hypothetical protein